MSRNRTKNSKPRKLHEYVTYLQDHGFSEKDVGLLYLNFIIYMNKQKLVSQFRQSNKANSLRARKREFVEDMREKFRDITEMLNHMQKDSIIDSFYEKNRFLDDKAQIIYGLEQLGTSAFSRNIENILLVKLQDDVSFADIGKAVIKGSRKYISSIKQKETFFKEYNTIQKYLDEL